MISENVFNIFIIILYIVFTHNVLCNSNCTSKKKLLANLNIITATPITVAVDVHTGVHPWIPLFLDLKAAFFRGFVQLKTIFTWFTCVPIFQFPKSFDEVALYHELFVTLFSLIAFDQMF